MHRLHKAVSYFWVSAALLYQYILYSSYNSLIPTKLKNCLTITQVSYWFLVRGFSFLVPSFRKFIIDFKPNG